MKTKLLITGVVAILMFAAGCNTDPVDDPLVTGKNSGVLVLKITDAPFPANLVERAMVTIDWIKIKKTGLKENENDDDPNSYIFILEKDTTIDLLKLSNGVTEILAKVEVPKGEYSEVRMHIKESSLKLFDDNTDYSLKIPSGGTSGMKIKIAPALVVSEGIDSELLLDVDASRSFKIIGNDKGKKGIKGFMFNPVVRAAAVSQSGKIQGIVTEPGGAKVKDAWVSLVVEKTTGSPTAADTIASSKTTASGYYAIIGVPAGTYKMVCEKEGYNDNIVPSVIVNKATTITKDFVMIKK